MVASGTAKKARQHVFKNSGRIEDLSKQSQKYINKKINNLTNKIKGNGVSPAFSVREFPCQMISGKIAWIADDAKPVFNEEDGKWYLNNELIVSRNYKDSLKPKKSKGTACAVVNGDAATDAAIVSMSPEVLGDESN